MIVSHGTVPGSILCMRVFRLAVFVHTTMIVRSIIEQMSKDERKKASDEVAKQRKTKNVSASIQEKQRRQRVLQV